MENSKAFTGKYRKYQDIQWKIFRESNRKYEGNLMSFQNKGGAHQVASMMHICAGLVGLKHGN